MKTLPKQFDGNGEVKGFKYTQIHKTRSAFMYEVVSSEGNIHFEVFKRIIKRGGLVKYPDGREVVYEDQEVYPRARSFGEWAWTYRNLEEAKKKLNILK